MAYEMVMPYHLHMPSYFLETFTEYPHLQNNFAPHLKPLRYGAINDLTETFPLKTINKQLSPPLSHYPPHPLYKNVSPEPHMLSAPGID